MSGASSVKPARLRPGIWSIAALFILCFLGALLLLPVWSILRNSFDLAGTDPLSGLRRVLGNRYYYSAIFNSLSVALATTFFAVLIGVPLAWIVSSRSLAGRALIRSLIVVIFVSPPFIGTYSWVVLLGRSGILRGWFAGIGIDLPELYGPGGIIFIFTLQFFPFVFLTVSNGLRLIDRSITEAGQNLGRSETATFFTLVLPLLVPAISAGALLVFVAAFTDIGAPIIIGERFRMLSVLIYSEFNNELGSQAVLASTMSVILVLLTTLILLLQRSISRRWSWPLAAVRPVAPVGKAGLSASLYAWALVGIAVLPLITMLVSSFLPANGPILSFGLTLDNYRYLSGIIWGPLRNTLWFTTVATLACALLGTVAAYLIVRGSKRLGNAVDILVMFSYGVPGIVLGIGLIATYNQGALVLTGTATIIILAYIIRRLPFSVRSGVSALQQLSPETEEASLNLGAGPLRTFALITVPLLSGAILSGALLTWSNTVRELGASLILQSGGNITIAVEIFSQILNGNFGRASALGAVLIGLTFIPLVIFYGVMGRREGLQA